MFPRRNGRMRRWFFEGQPIPEEMPDDSKHSWKMEAVKLLYSQNIGYYGCRKSTATSTPMTRIYQIILAG